MAQNVRSKKVKQIFKLIDAGAGIVDKISTISEAWDLAVRYATSDMKADSLKKAANLKFDTLDFIAGFFAGGAYYKAGITAARAYLELLTEHYGEIRFTEIYSDESILQANSTVTGYPQYRGAYWKDPDFYTFARAWFSAAWDPVNTYKEDRLILMNIGEYIWAVKTLQNVGLL